MSTKTSVAAWKRFVVFLLGMPGYLATFMPWLFSIALVFYASVSLAQNDYIYFEVEQLNYETLSVNIGTVIASFLISGGLWIFIAWLTKHMLLIIAQLFGGSEKTWQIVKVSGLFFGWFVVFLLAFFIFDAVVPGFMVSLIFVNSVALLSYFVEYLAGKLLIKKA